MVYEGQPFDTPEDALAHFGVKGMKWGVRKSEDSSSSGSSGSESKKIESGAYGSMAAVAKKRGKFVEDWGDPLVPKVSTSKIAVNRAAKSQSLANATEKRLTEVNADGFNSSYLRAKYGNSITSRSERYGDKAFKLFYGKTKDDLLASEKLDLQTKLDKLNRDTTTKAAGKLTRNEKIAIGAAVVGAGLLVYGGYKTKQITRQFAPGEDIGLTSFMYHVSQSQRRNWMGDTAISKSAFDALDDSPVRLSAASTTFQRLAGTAETSVRDATYLTHTADDAKRYQAVFTRELAGRGISEYHAMSIKPSKDLIGPSAKERVKLFQELLEKDEKAVGNLRSLVAPYGPFNISESRDSMALKYYNTMVASQGGKDKLSLFYFELVKSKGYNILTDDMDAGVIGDAPMILLDSAAAKVTGSSVLSSADIAAASSSLTELANRR